jgi:hypothetical protein
LTNEFLSFAEKKKQHNEELLLRQQRNAMLLRQQHYAISDLERKLRDLLPITDGKMSVGSLQQSQKDEVKQIANEIISIISQIERNGEGEKYSLATAYNDLGAVFLSEGNTKSTKQAYGYFRKSQGVFEEIGDVDGVVMTKKNIIIYYVEYLIELGIIILMFFIASVWWNEESWSLFPLKNFVGCIVGAVLVHCCYV